MAIDPGWTDPSVTVVDDEPIAQDVLSRAARQWHYQCQVADNAEQALLLLEQRPTPIVVTDLLMPGRGGVWLVGEVRRRWPHIGIIVLTAGHDPEAAEACLHAGADHYFFKPIKLDEYRHVLEAAWRGYQRLQEQLRHRAELERAIHHQTHRVRRTFLSAIDSLARTLEERDPYTAGHSRRVREYALQLAQAIGLDEPTCRRLSLAAKLHDIGKVGVPECILNKPGRLTAEEETVVRTHPVTGERILRPIVRNRKVLEAIRGHHERLDGSGYPDGLRGSAVPLLARLVAIPDCFDALTTCRAYRQALTQSEALRVLREGAGWHFDTTLVQTFIEMIERKGM
jgi:putative nucleotidyltransferase with HDIG domain